jgi:hypothetical protein
LLLLLQLLLLVMKEHLLLLMMGNSSRAANSNLSGRMGHQQGSIAGHQQWSSGRRRGEITAAAAVK